MVGWWDGDGGVRGAGGECSAVKSECSHTVRQRAKVILFLPCLWIVQKKITTENEQRENVQIQGAERVNKLAANLCIDIRHSSY